MRTMERGQMPEAIYKQTEPLIIGKRVGRV